MQVGAREDEVFDCSKCTRQNPLWRPLIGKSREAEVTGFCFIVQIKDSDISQEYLLTQSCHDIADPLL